MKSDDLISVYTTDAASDAEVVKIGLQNEGIHSEINGEGQAGLTGLGIMKIEVLVRAIDADAARRYVEKHQGN